MRRSHLRQKCLKQKLHEMVDLLFFKKVLDTIFEKFISRIFLEKKSKFDFTFLRGYLPDFYITVPERGVLKDVISDEVGGLILS